MSAIKEFSDQIRGWLNFDYTDGLVLSWVRMAEERINNELRVREMIKIDRATFTSNPAAFLPDDWLEMDLVRRLDRAEPLKFVARHDFFGKENDGYFTIIGSYLMVGGHFGVGTEIEIASFRQVPPLTEEPTWLYEKYPRLLTAATLTMAVAYGIEDERAPLWEAETQNRINTMNAAFQTARISGGRVTRRTQKRSFG